MFIKLKTLNNKLKFSSNTFNSKDFSIFQKIKKLTKSAEYKNTESINSQRNPDDIEVEYDRPDKTQNKKKQKKSYKGLTPEELTVLKNLPNDTISNY